MEREEQVEIAINHTIGRDNIPYRNGFKSGVQWADKNPAENWIAYSEKYKNSIDAIKEAKDILESVSMGTGFVIPFRAREWLVKINTLLT